MSPLIFSALAATTFTAAAPWYGTEPSPAGFEPAGPVAQVQVTDRATTLASSLGTEPFLAGHAAATATRARGTVPVDQDAGSVTPTASLGAEPLLARERSAAGVAAARADRAPSGEALPSAVTVARSCACR